MSEVNNYSYLNKKFPDWYTEIEQVYRWKLEFLSKNLFISEIAHFSYKNVDFDKLKGKFYDHLSQLVSENCTLTEKLFKFNTEEVKIARWNKYNEIKHLPNEYITSGIVRNCGWLAEQRSYEKTAEKFVELMKECISE